MIVSMDVQAPGMSIYRFMWQQNLFRNEKRADLPYQLLSHECSYLPHAFTNICIEIQKGPHQLTDVIPHKCLFSTKRSHIYVAFNLSIYSAYSLNFRTFAESITDSSLLPHIRSSIGTLSIHMMSGSSFLNCIGILIVSFRNTLPFAVHLQQKQNVCEINSVSPSFLQNTYNSQGFLDKQYINPRLKALASRNRILPYRSRSFFG